MTREATDAGSTFFNSPDPLPNQHVTGPKADLDHGAASLGYHLYWPETILAPSNNAGVDNALSLAAGADG